MQDDRDHVWITNDLDVWLSLLGSGFREMSPTEELRARARVRHCGQEADENRTPYEGDDPSKGRQP